MAVNLTTGAIPMISSPGGCQADLKPVLQIIHVRIMPGTQTSARGGENKERCMFQLSDGMFSQIATYSTQLNDLVRSQQLQKGSIVQLTEFFVKFIRERVILIIIKLNLIMDKCDIIGDPKPLPIIPAGNNGDETFSIFSGLYSYVNEKSEAPMQCSIKQPAATVTRPTTRVEGGNDDEDVSRPITCREYKELISEIRKSNNKLDMIFDFLKKA